MHVTPPQSKLSLPPPNQPGSIQLKQEPSKLPQHLPGSEFQKAASKPPVQSGSEAFGYPLPQKQSSQHLETPPIEAVEKAESTTPTPLAVAREPLAVVEPPIVPEVSTEYIPQIRNLETHGGFAIPHLAALGEELSKLRPGVPFLEELGVVDIHALTMSIQSGINGEMRYALGQLVTLSSDQRLQLSLVDCGDLMETLVDCAEDHLEILADYAEEASDQIDIPPFEEICRAARMENEGLQDNPLFTSQEYEWHRAAERILIITAILRNMSFADSAPNHDMLAGKPLISFISSAVRLMGTRNMPFINARNTQNFMKDVVTLLSNISHRVELPGNEEATCLLHFLSSFRPAPPGSSDIIPGMSFSPYDPNVHHYLPSAIDAFAKLLARDDPNRTYCKSVFASDLSSSATPTTTPNTRSPSQYLITRAFALAIAPMPDRSKGNYSSTLSSTSTIVRLAEARKPFLSQGMLAADILASLVTGSADPGNGTTLSLAQLWLESEDGWAKSLMDLVLQLATDAGAGGGMLPAPPQRHPSTGRLVADDAASAAATATANPTGLGIIVQRASGMLLKLAEKCEKKDGPGRDGVVVDFTDVAPGAEVMLAALTNPVFDPVALRHLVGFVRVAGFD